VSVGFNKATSLWERGIKEEKKREESRGDNHHDDDDDITGDRIDDGDVPFDAEAAPVGGRHGRRNGPRSR